MPESERAALAAPYDVEAVRKDFPILSREVYGKPLVYLDNGASAQKPQVVIDAVSHAYSNEYANVHRGLHFLSNAATDAYEAAREKVRRFLNAGSVDEIVFTKSSTEAINTVAYGYGMPKIGEGDEIVISIMEHHSNIVPWHFIRERQGAKLVWVPVDDDGAFHIEAFEKSLTERTKLVAITHMSNALGTIVPVKEICRIAHERGIPVLVDGSQGAVHMPVDVRDIDCDWYVMTGHKLYGPSGIGVLYGKADRLSEMRPFQGGGEMILDVSEDNVTYNEPPHRFEAGTPPIVQAIGLGYALDYMDNLGRAAIAAHEADLAAYAAERLREVNSLRIIGNAPDKGGIFSFELEGIHAHDVSMVIDRRGVAVRAGTHCAMPLLKRFGVTSTCRASFGLYNTRAEVDSLVEALEYARKFFA
ncbi:MULTISPECIES: cysteine desulfurase [Agrobacterium tumefaciens complex]|jgi:cysteine desulfurase/selenocysteine lyase|uniref:Cysteine desulfurase n=2 Tax=Agrobacterium tumefaciens complex TaxID=1183400 RepID=A0ABD5LHI6_AGRRD|nr:MULTISPECIES: cysteine desulfurase [Agrobacterium tumefaciens complex]MCP2134439.1 cysteine desulfurase/selenocysteine lyase [Rhizobium sp. SLBN-94]TGE80275.1 cysteine desulfurase [Rhizobium sp. SEMIA 439]EPR20950.1 cysteine desulfurase [Agrobacterium radiobacter DSM 30147]KAA1237170.1 cysteine desulfurase [Agrobacterium tumefaciens]KAB0462142.1 cysteine desulfurase [Agrobacterium tumefaciens]